MEFHGTPCKNLQLGMLSKLNLKIADNCVSSIILSRKQSLLNSIIYIRDFQTFRALAVVW